MTIRVARGTLTRICDHREGFALQVQHPTHLPAALAALRHARADILRLGTVPVSPSGSHVRDDGSTNRPLAPSVSQVVVAPNGPLLLVERLDAGYEALRTIPDVLVRHLEEAEVDDATIACPDSGGILDALDTTSGAVVLRLFPNPAGAAGAVPPDWLDIAAEWVLGDLDETDHVLVRILSVEFEVTMAEASSVLHQCGLARAWCDIVNGSIDDRIRTASLTFGRLPHLALAAGGPGAENTGMLARFALLQDIARELAPHVTYACLDFEATFEGLPLGLSPDGWRRHGGAPPNLVAAELVDELVPDAFPYQVVGPGHLNRLGPSRSVERLAGGRAAVSIGRPADWLLTSPVRDELQESGWDVLRACLADDDEVYKLLHSRPSRAPAGGDESAENGVEPDSTLPDFDTIVLEGQPHSRRGTRLTVLELVSWLDHEGHSDSPSSVAPVLATFVRWWAAGLDDATRQRLKERAPALSGTAGRPDIDKARRWAVIDWLVRVQAPTWLELAGMAEAARRLRELGAPTDHLELVRAVDVLGSAITIASRRIDITASIADDDLPADQWAWEAWDEVSEPAAWVAASEAGTEGAPSELTYATDLRVIECSRDPRARDEIDAAHVSVGDTTWATALHAVANDAWDRGWRAADRAALELSSMHLREHIRRISDSLVHRPDADLEEFELEAAEDAARDELTRAALRGGTPDESGQHPWDAARAAAASSVGGSTWTAIQDEARRAVGEDAWAQAMADARSVVEATLRTAPDIVARVVTVAVAREAASAAARGAAHRAEVVAIANGATPEEAEEAAHESLRAAGAALQESAFELLDRLIDPSRPTLRPGDQPGPEEVEGAPALEPPPEILDLSHIQLP